MTMIEERTATGGAMSPRPETWRRSLEDVNRIDGVAGALLVSRDGICVLNLCPPVRRPELPAAMAATMLAAGETLAAEMGAPQMGHFLLAMSRQMLIGIAATDTLMVVVLLKDLASAERTLPQIERIVRSVARERPW